MSNLQPINLKNLSGEHGEVSRSLYASNFVDGSDTIRLILAFKAKSSSIYLTREQACALGLWLVEASYHRELPK
jgi:hypothetical protein